MTLKAMLGDDLRRLDRANHNPYEYAFECLTLEEQGKALLAYSIMHNEGFYEGLHEAIVHDYPTDAETAAYNWMQEVEERYLMQEWANSR